MSSWDEKLVKLEGFDEVLHAVVQKSRQRPQLLFQPAGGSEVHLHWILQRSGWIKSEIQRSLKQGGELLSPVRLTRIKAGKWREIYINNWPDRILLMIVARLLNQALEQQWSHRLYSFRKGWGSHKALEDLSQHFRQTSGPLYVLKRDVSQYGDSISRALLMKRLSSEPSLRGGELLLKLVDQALRSEVSAESTYCLHRGIPSGSPLVPVLENYYLLPLDRRLIEEAQFYGRYGDDFVAVCSSSAQALRCEERIAEILSELELKTKPEKHLNRTLSGATDGFVWLGRWVDRAGRLGPKTERLSAVMVDLKRQINGLVMRSRLVSSPELQKKMLRRGIKQLLDASQSSELGRVYLESESPKLKQDIRDYALRTFVMAIQSAYRLRRRQAWRWLRLTGFHRMETTDGGATDEAA